MEMTTWPREDRWAAIADPISPVPPTRAIFITVSAFEKSRPLSLTAAPNEFFQKGKNFQQHGREQEPSNVCPWQRIAFENKVEACSPDAKPPQADNV